MNASKPSTQTGHKGRYPPTVSVCNCTIRPHKRAARSQQRLSRGGLATSAYATTGKRDSEGGNGPLGYVRGLCRGAGKRPESPYGTAKPARLYRAIGRGLRLADASEREAGPLRTNGNAFPSWLRADRSPVAATLSNGGQPCGVRQAFTIAS